MESEENQAFQSLFPPPPPYYKRYGINSDISRDSPLLQPPQPITDKPYFNYGLMLTSTEVLTRPSDDHAKELYQDESQIVGELKKLNRALCFSFLELLNILIERPNAKFTEDEQTTTFDREKFNEDFMAGKIQEKFAWEQKVQQIHLILINMSYLLNSYRPQQARQQLISILDDSYKKRTSASVSLRDTLDICRRMLQETKDLLSERDQLQEEDDQTIRGSKRKRENIDENINE